MAGGGDFSWLDDPLSNDNTIPGLDDTSNDNSSALALVQSMGYSDVQSYVDDMQQQANSAWADEVTQFESDASALAFVQSMGYPDVQSYLDDMQQQRDSAWASEVQQFRSGQATSLSGINLNSGSSGGGISLGGGGGGGSKGSGGSGSGSQGGGFNLCSIMPFLPWCPTTSPNGSNPKPSTTKTPTVGGLSIGFLLLILAVIILFKKKG